MKKTFLTIILLTTFGASLYANENKSFSALSKYTQLKNSSYISNMEDKRDLLSKQRDVRDRVRNYQELKREYLSLSI